MGAKEPNRVSRWGGYGSGTISVSPTPARRSLDPVAGVPLLGWDQRSAHERYGSLAHRGRSDAGAVRFGWSGHSQHLRLQRSGLESEQKRL